MATTSQLHIGFIGLGVMGLPMAGHLAAAGHHITAFDINPDALRRLQSTHPAATGAASPGAAGAGADVVFTMVPDGHAVQQVSTGSDGLFATMREGAILVDTSSSQPWLTVETAAALAAKGVAMVDAPVSGAQWGAESAELVFMVGGTDVDVARITPLLDVLGRATFHVGPLGSGHIMKTINNTITAMTFLATSEGLALGAKAGLDPAAMNDVLNESTGGSWITANHIGQRILSRTFDDPFKLDLMVKDVGIAMQLARDRDTDLPFAELCESLYRSAAEFAGEGASVSELVRWVESTTGVEIARGQRTN